MADLKSKYKKNTNQSKEKEISKNLLENLKVKNTEIEKKEKLVNFDSYLANLKVDTKEIKETNNISINNGNERTITVKSGFNINF